jgi:hypothetical protein
MTKRRKEQKEKQRSKKHYTQKCFSFFSVKRCTCSSRMKYMMGPFLRQVQNGAYFIYQWSIFVNSLRGTKWGSC